jgi:hypothetical protein
MDMIELSEQVMELEAKLSELARELDRQEEDEEAIRYNVAKRLFLAVDLSMKALAQELERLGRNGQAGKN